MERRLQNKFTMCQNVWRLTSAPENQAAVQTIPAFGIEAAGLAALIPKIRKSSRLALGMDSTGVTESKDLLRIDLAEEVHAISCGVVAYARAAKDVGLASSARVTRTMIQGGRELDAADVADNLLAVALARIGSLASHGVSRDQLDSLDELIQSFSDQIGRPRALIGQRKQVIASLPDLFAQADAHLGQMDLLSALLVRTQPAFVRNYQAARRIVHQAATRTKKEGGGTTPKVASSETTPTAAPDRNGAAEPTEAKEGLQA